MTFNAPVEIPGKVLEPGTYVFKLFDSQSDRAVVQIFTEDEKQIVATVMGVSDYRSTTPEKTVVTFEERRAGTPEAIHSWFYPGDNYGVEFVYNKKQDSAPYEKPALVTAAPKVEAPAAPVEVAAAPEPPATAPEPEPVVVQEEPTGVIAEEPAPGFTLTPEPELPKTAGNFLLIPIAGLTLLAGGLAALRFAARQS